MSDGDWVSAVFKGIMDKFANSALSTDLSGRLFFESYDLNPPVIYPYGIFSVVAATPDRTFTEAYQDILIQFSILSPKTSGVAALSLIQNHLVDLYDECSLTITGFHLEWMRVQNHAQTKEDIEALPDGSTELYNWSTDFEIRISKN
jgi:hypothetical protein